MGEKLEKFRYSLVFFVVIISGSYLLAFLFSKLLEQI